MAKKESTFFNMLATLVTVTLVASTALGFVYELTKEPIAAARLARKLEAINAVVETYENNPVDDMYMIPTVDGTDSLECYPAMKNGALVGTAIRSYSRKGYGGLIWVMIGITPEATIFETAVIEHKETPGLGTKMSEPAFKDQFKGIDPTQFEMKVTKDGGEVDGITAATISSRAFCQAAQLAFDSYEKGGNK